MKANNEKLTTEVNNFQAKTQQLEVDMANKNTKLSETQVMVTASAQKVEQLHKKVVDLQAKLDQTEATYEVSQTEVKEKVSGLEIQIKTKDSEIELLQKQLDNTKGLVNEKDSEGFEQLQKRDAIIDQLKEQATINLQQIHNSEKVVEDQQLKIKNLESKVAENQILITENDELKATIKEMQAKIQKDVDYKKIVEELGTKTERIAKLDARNVFLEEEVAKMKLGYSNRCLDVTNLRSTLKEKDAQMKTLNDKINALSQQIASLKSHQGPKIDEKTQKHINQLQSEVKILRGKLYRVNEVQLKVEDFQKQKERIKFLEKEHDRLKYELKTHQQYVCLMLKFHRTQDTVPNDKIDSLKESFTQQISTLKSELQNYNAKVEDLEHQNSELYSNMVVLQEKYRSVQNHNLEEEPRKQPDTAEEEQELELMNESYCKVQDEYDANEFCHENEEDDEEELYSIDELNEYFPVEETTKDEQESEINREPLVDRSNVIEVFDSEYNFEHIKEMGFNVNF